jgi:hypothetical protein
LARRVAPEEPPLFSAPISAPFRFASVVVQKPPSIPSLCIPSVVEMLDIGVSTLAPAIRRRILYERLGDDAVRPSNHV